MSYIRFRKHYLHIPYVLLGFLEFLWFWLVPGLTPAMLELVGLEANRVAVNPGTALLFALVLSLGTLSMGIYMAFIQEGWLAMFFRSLVAYFFLSGLALTLLHELIPATGFNSNFLLVSICMALAGAMLLRLFFILLVDLSQLNRHIVIYGTGAVAAQLVEDYNNYQSFLGVKIIGCIRDTDNPIVASDLLMEPPTDWPDFVRRHRISEVVMAPQERRRTDGRSLPMAELMECKLSGTEITDAQSFYERSMKKANIGLVQPSWILYSDGFRASRSRSATKRLLDLFIALSLALILAPIMLLTALAVMLDSGLPVLYSQHRVGKDGKPFRIYKFRSMRQDAEKEGKAVWASENDSRVTRVGAFIRNTRLDELPQLYNVLRGDMSFVGPRPERPEFVSELNEKIPFYGTRHYVKPGLMGWAQLNYPYGASVDDARGKLEYDLYYSKNHSLLMDILIMIQTVEVVLLGKGVR
ncbi:MAG TPA: TIGR03013 family XrtA/PEP-CTERM system glycosyltransferase [Saccharospirillum sp.]|nr:TIGR03013 family XrtA/PEP-CTERM system glycosyltransferase [Saccharospirillum sp.]